MNGSYLFLQIFRGIWAIEPGAARAATPTIKRLLDGEPMPNRIFAEGEEDPFKPFAYSPAQPGYYSGFEKAQPGSIAVIPVVDVLTKYDQDCGPVGTATIARWMQQAERSANIEAIVLKIDSPGGTVDGTEVLAQMIANTTKPVVAFIDGMMCSAAYWIGSAADELIASTTTDIIGSIGTMMSWADMQPYWEKMGVKFHEVYADASKDKNKIFRQAENGDYKPLKEKILNPTNDVFVEAVKKNRGSRLNAEAKGVLSGEIFMADVCVTNGLIDRIGTFDVALQRAGELADAKKTKTQNDKSMKFSTAWKNTLAFFGIKSEDAEKTDVTVEHVEKLEQELAEKIALQAEHVALRQAHEGQVASATEQKNKILQLEADLKTANEKVATLNTKVEKLSKLDGAKVEETAKDEETGVDPKLNGMEHIDWSAEHNKTLAEMLGYRVVDGKPVKK